METLLGDACVYELLVYMSWFLYVCTVLDFNQNVVRHGASYLMDVICLQF